MSEKLSDHEALKADSAVEAEATHHARYEHVTKRHESSEPDKNKVEEIKDKIEDIQDKEPNVVQKAEPDTQEQIHILPPDKALKKQARRNYLSSIRSNLTTNDKLLSKFIHQQTVDNLSEVASKTLLRPSGVLFGGIVTLIGSGYYLYATKRAGYHYNFFTALVLFAGGFVVGLVIEFLYSMIRTRSKDS